MKVKLYFYLTLKLYRLPNFHKSLTTRREQWGIPFSDAPEKIKIIV